MSHRQSGLTEMNVSSVKWSVLLEEMNVPTIKRSVVLEEINVLSVELRGLLEKVSPPQSGVSCWWRWMSHR